MQNFLYDLRYAMRQLRNTPGMALLAILTLALGVGANTAIFTVIDSVLLRPLPYAHSDRLVFIGPGGDKPSFGSTSWMNYARYSCAIEAAGRLSRVRGGRERAGGERRLGERGCAARDAEPVHDAGTASIAGTHVRGGRGQTGRAFGGVAVRGIVAADISRRSEYCRTSGEGRRKARDGRRRDAGDRSIFLRVWEPDLKKGVWLPIQPTQEMLKQRGYHFFNVAGVMRPGVTVAQVQQEISAIARAHSARAQRYAGHVSG